MGGPNAWKKEGNNRSLWYAVNTKRKQEQVAAVNLKSLGFEVFNPRVRRLERLFGSRVETSRSLFPAYIFARFDANQHYRTVKYTVGVRQIVSFGTDLAPVSEEIISLIKNRVDDGDLLDLRQQSFKSGDQVEVVAGALAGLTGLLEREMSGSERVAVLLNAISFRATLLIGSDHLKRIVEVGNSAGA
jgi:transcription elongation factor/antiterminator RfaH